MNKSELLELNKKLIELCNQNNIEWEDFDYSESDEWIEGYGFTYKQSDKKYVINMCGGCQGWWNYVITPQGCYKENESGLMRLDNDLWSDPDGNYIAELSQDYEARDEEINMFEMCQECFFE
eukprot:SAG11_NODE_1252_length_5386_cov_29.101759_2_plen_122_part_00